MRAGRLQGSDQNTLSYNISLANSSVSYWKVNLDLRGEPASGPPLKTSLAESGLPGQEDRGGPTRCSSENPRRTRYSISKNNSIVVVFESPQREFKASDAFASYRAEDTPYIDYILYQ